MADLLLLIPPGPRGAGLKALELLSHGITQRELTLTAPLRADGVDVIVIDGTADLAAARAACTALEGSAPTLLVVTEGALVAVSHEWGAGDVVLDGAGPAEVDARIRLLAQRHRAEHEPDAGRLRAAGLTLDQAAYTARLRGTPLDLTYKEFELLKHLMAHPGQVFTRGQLLHEVWGYDYFGGTRTVDVHVRRLRAKLGADHEALIGTVRNVGYRFCPPRGGTDDEGDVR